MTWASRISVATSRSAASSVRRSRSSSSAVFAGDHFTVVSPRLGAGSVFSRSDLETSPANRKRAVGSRGVSVEKPRSRGALDA